MLPERSRHGGLIHHVPKKAAELLRSQDQVAPTGALLDARAAGQLHPHRSAGSGTTARQWKRRRSRCPGRAEDAVSSGAAGSPLRSRVPRQKVNQGAASVPPFVARSAAAALIIPASRREVFLVGRGPVLRSTERSLRSRAQLTPQTKPAPATRHRAGRNATAAPTRQPPARASSSPSTLSSWNRCRRSPAHRQPPTRS